MKPYLFLLYLLLSACAGLPSAIENAPALPISYSQASHNTNDYKDAPIRWGGVVVSVENEAQSSLMQVLFYPLDNSGRPQLYEPVEGRFVVKSAEFLDPAIYTEDKEITVAGAISGNIERTVGERIIQVPLVSATAIHLWPAYANRYGYRGYYPFYRGGLYRPYFRW